jgi:hypothetical protein
MFDEALSGKVKLFRYLLNKNTCCTVIVTIELSVKSFLVISFFWWSEFHVPSANIRHLLTDLEQQISNRFQSANRVRCDKTYVSFQQIWIKIRWRQVL